MEGGAAEDLRGGADVGQSKRIGHGDGAGEEVMVRSERRGDVGGASACFRFVVRFWPSRSVWCGVVWCGQKMSSCW